MKNTKKIISVLLCIVMMLSCASAALVASAATTCTCKQAPVIYIKGRTNIYKTTDDTSDENMAETNFSGGSDSIVEASKNIISAFAMALLTDEWDEYCDVLYDEIIPIYDQYKLNENGEIDNESGIDPKWSLENLLKEVQSRGKNAHKNTYNHNNLEYTQFQYDMRLDPRDNAEDLNTYIEKIKEVSGHSKVNIAARCEGTVILNAYLHTYGYDSVDKVVVYNAISNGAEIADELFSNKVVSDAEYFNYFISQFLDTSPVLDLVKETVNLATFNGLLQDGIDAVDSIYDKISSILMPRLIRDIFGTCPGWWGMVSPEVLEECKDFVFEGNVDGKYDKLIEKIDGYNAMKKTARSVLEDAQAAGVKVYILAKYGNQMYPVIESYDVLGDGVVSLYKQTFSGATTASFTGKLSEDYINERINLGFADYISADEKVDASTAAFKDHTWFFKELPHDTYPRSVDNLIVKMFAYDGYATVNTFEDMPQFMHFEASYDEEGKDVGIITPLTEENKDKTTVDTETSSILSVIFRFFTAVFNFIASLFKK